MFIIWCGSVVSNKYYMQTIKHGVHYLRGDEYVIATDLLERRSTSNCILAVRQRWRAATATTSSTGEEDSAWDNSAEKHANVDGHRHHRHQYPGLRNQPIPSGICHYHLQSCYRSAVIVQCTSRQSAFKRRADRLKRRRARSFLPRWARGQPAGFAEGRARSIGCASFVKLRGILNRQSRAERQNRTKLTVKLNKLQIILTEHDCRM